MKRILINPIVKSVVFTLILDSLALYSHALINVLKKKVQTKEIRLTKDTKDV
jgi:hypothetical protein